MVEAPSAEEADAVCKSPGRVVSAKSWRLMGSPGLYP